MEISDIRIGVPLLRLEVRIFHATPRKPTAFERVILGMAERFGQNESFNSTPLEQLFVDVLCVSDPGPLVTPTLSELVALDVIRCGGDIEALDTLILRDIEITERGQRMIAEDMLPAKSMQNEEIFYFDPIRQRLVSESKSRAYRPVAPRYAIDPSAFEGIFPEESIRSSIDKSAYRWFSASSNIEKIESLSVQVLWKDTPCTIELLSDSLKVVSKDEGLNNYLESIESNDAYERFVAPIFDVHNFPHEELPNINNQDLGETETNMQTIQQVLTDWPSDARIVIPGPNYDSKAIPVHAPAHQAIVLYHANPSAEPLSVEWNHDRSGCKLWVNETHPIPFCLRVTDRESLVCGRIKASYGNEARNLIVARRIPAHEEDDYLTAPLSRLSELVKTLGNSRDQSILTFWESESRFIENQMHKLSDSALSLDEIIQQYFLTQSDVERLTKRVNRDAWLKGLWTILLGHISRLEGMGMKEFEQALKTLSAHGSYPADMISELLGGISKVVKRPQSLDELSGLTSVFRILDKDWCLAYPSELFTKELARLILERFPDHLDPKLISGDNTLFNPLRALLQISNDLNVVIGPNGLGGLKNDDDYVSLIKAKTGSFLSDKAHAWAAEMDSLLSVLEDETVLEGTHLAIANIKISEIAGWTEKLVGALDQRIRSVYVLDTSALIDLPEIVSEVRQGELFVVTKRVIEELDDKKLDEALRPYVSEAVRNLRKLRKGQIQFCDGDMSLLPSDYRLKGDNLILSVAVRYRKHNPVLVTNDNNLSLKAEAEGLKAISAEAFVKRPRVSSQKHNRKGSDYIQSRKRNQGNERRKR